MSEQPRWLTADERRAWLALVAMCESLPAALDTQLKRDAGVNNFEYMVLAGASDAPDQAILMSELAAFASGSLSRLSHAVTRLEKRGIVQRRPLPGDGRQTLVALTDAGRALMARVAPDHVAEVRRLVFDGIAAEDVDALARIAGSIVRRSNPALTERFAPEQPA